MWHPDVIHAVEDQDNAQLHPANVVYTAALPMCPLNARYVSPLHSRCYFLFSLVSSNVYPFFSCVYRLILSFPAFSALRYLVRQRTAFLDGIKPPDFCEGSVEKTCAPSSRRSFTRAKALGVRQSYIFRYTETNHPERRTTFKDLVSVGRRMMCVIIAMLACRVQLLCNALCMGFDKYADPADPKEKELLQACNAILFPSV